MIHRPNHKNRACVISVGLLWSSIFLGISRNPLCCSFTIPTGTQLQNGAGTARLDQIGPISYASQFFIPLRDVAETTNSDLEITNASTPLDAATLTLSQTVDSVDENDDEYEYLEFDNLTEQEFIASEWMVGTNWDRNPNRIDETWARLIVDADGKNIVVWGDESKGTWTLDVATQFLSLSKENVFNGKQIWACTVSDYYYLQGTVRGWNYWSAAAVIGQWQAKRLGVDRDEAGTPPWFEGINDTESQ
jgi:hypothetical protein